jgi:NADPH2:quinone reductase
MQAIVVHQFGAPDVMRLESRPDPVLNPHQVLVRIRAAGVNPVDSYIRAGTYAIKPPLPYTPGSDGAGLNETVGAEVKQFRAGDRVYIALDGSSPMAGTYAELAVCLPSMLHTLPERVSFAQGAAIGVPYATAYRALFMRTHATPKETVLVHGATGGVGLAAVELAHAHGMTVFGTGGTERGLETVRAHGADMVFSHREPGYLDAVMKATGGRGVDLILEMAAHINLDKDFGVLARFGRIAVIGSRGRVEIDPRQIMGRDATMTGQTMFNVTPDEHAQIHDAIVAGLAAGTLNPVINREMPLAEAARAHDAVLEPGALGKIVLIP